MRLLQRVVDGLIILGIIYLMMGLSGCSTLRGMGEDMIWISEVQHVTE